MKLQKIITLLDSNINPPSKFNTIKTRPYADAH